MEKWQFSATGISNQYHAAWLKACFDIISHGFLTCKPEKFGLDKTNIKKEHSCGSPKELEMDQSLNRRINQIPLQSIFFPASQ